MVRKKSVDDGSVKRREGGGIIEADHGRSLIKAARQPNFRRKSKGGCEREIGPLLDARGEESVGPSHEAPWRLAGPLPRPRHAFPKTLFVVTDPSASPPPLSPNNRRFLSDRADPPMIFHYGTNFYFSRCTRSMENGTRSRALRVDVIYMLADN